MPKIYTVEWSDEAIKDLNDIYASIFRESPQNAQMVNLELLYTGGRLSTFPNGFPIEHSLNPRSITYRFILRWNYKIIFFVQGETVSIVNVFTTHKSADNLWD